MQYLRSMTVSIDVRQPDEDGVPRLEDFVASLERELAWWREHGRQEHLSGADRRVEYGVVRTREDDDDIWCH